MVNVSDLVAQLAAEAEVMKPQPNEFGLADFAVAANMSISSASRFLTMKVKAGAIQKRIGLVNGKRGWLYSATNNK